MSRHRNIRSMNYNEEYDTYYDVYGQSVEEDGCISPGTAAQFMYDRTGQSHSMSAYLDEDEPEPLPEEPEDEENLSPFDQARLRSCIEEIQNIVGETVGEAELKQAVIRNNYDMTKALDAVLTKEEPKPQRVKRERNRQAGEKKAAVIIENISQPVNPIAEVSIPPQVEEPKPAVTLAADKQVLTNRGPSQHLAVETSQVKNGSRNSSRSPSPAPGVATPTLPKRNIRAQESSDPLTVYSRERSSQKPLLNLVVIGHVDAGKSTLMGHVLYRLGCVSKKTMHKNEQDSKKMGKSSFMYAWVLDETPEERSRGITMDIAQSRFETPHRSVTLLDAPGHRDFIPNMITGAAQADNAILVVDGTRGEFEAGFEAGGQTREHTLLVRSLGVSQLAVVVNKMDNESWSEDRYNAIVTKMSAFLKQAGFKDSDVQFVPCSGLTGDNLTSPLAKDNPQVTWYKGPCLLDIIDNFPAPARPISLPFRLSIADIFKGQGSGFCVGGKVESGLVQNGDKVLVMPAGETATVKGISQEESVNIQTAFAGDHVSLTLSGIDMNKVMCGDVVCDLQKPILASQRFRGRIVTFNLPVPLTQGCPTVLHYQSMSEQAVVKKLISQLHKGTGQVIKKKPRCLPKNASGIIELEVCRPICVELYKDNRDLGRFMLRVGGATVAAGVVTKVL